MKVSLFMLSSLAVCLGVPCGDTTTESSPTEPPPPVTTQPPPTVWPLGSYSLPQTTEGCPGSDWKEGAFYQDNEDYRNGNQWNTTHLGGFQKKEGYMNAFCTIVDNPEGGSWPQGSYCILKKTSCPQGFQDGAIFWDDENINNANHLETADVVLPDGTFTEDTRLEYCCRDDGDVSTAVFLPTAIPFYLLMKTNGGCQSVAGMSVTVETVGWDDEDTVNQNFREGSTPVNAGNPTNHGMHFCYYTPDSATTTDL